MPDDLHSRYLQILLRQLHEAQYPSITMLERLEHQISDPQMATEYVGILLDKIEQDDYPSPTMLDRVHELTVAIDQFMARTGQQG